MTKTDLSKHRMNNYDWLKEYITQRGKEAFNKFINDVYKFLLEIKPGSFFQIEGNVKPENIDFFIKVCCMFIHERYCSKQTFATEYIFSDNYSKIICREI
jgi:hypothetical protein